VRFAPKHSLGGDTLDNRFGGEECLNQDLLRWLSLSQNGADAKSCDYGTSDGERVHPLDHCGNAYVPTMYGRLYATDIGYVALILIQTCACAGRTRRPCLSCTARACPSTCRT